MTDFFSPGALQDGLKAFIYLVPLIFLVARQKELNLKYFWLLFTGLALLLFGNVLDFLDEFAALDGMFIIGDGHYLQDLFEDTVGFTLGFAIFIFALYLEFINKKK